MALRPIDGSWACIRIRRRLLPAGFLKPRGSERPRPWVPGPISRSPIHWKKSAQPSNTNWQGSRPLTIHTIIVVPSSRSRPPQGSFPAFLDSIIRGYGADHASGDQCRMRSTLKRGIGSTFKTKWNLTNRKSCRMMKRVRKYGIRTCPEDT
jgi:hypothetical protein